MNTCLGKSCSFGLPSVPFVNCCQFMYLVVSLLVLRAGCGIWLYQFLIIAYLCIFHANILRFILGVNKGLGSRTCRIGPVNWQKIKVAERKWHSPFFCAELSSFMHSTYSPLLIL